jgi:hypothetical protein
MSEPDDDALEQELGSLLHRADPIPPIVLAAGRAALGWRRLEGELAELLADSALPAGELSLARGVGVPVRSVTFGTGRQAIDLDIDVAGDRLRLRGQLSPPAAARVDVQRRDGATLASVIADDFGRFVAELPSRGTIRLRLTGQLGPGAIETAWIAV